MSRAFQELVLGGVLVAPAFFYAAAALLLVVLLRPVLHRIGFSNYFSHPPIAELSLYVALFGLLILID